MLLSIPRIETAITVPKSANGTTRMTAAGNNQLSYCAQDEVDHQHRQGENRHRLAADALLLERHGGPFGPHRRGELARGHLVHEPQGLARAIPRRGASADRRR